MASNLPATRQFELVEVPFHGDLLEAVRDVATREVLVVIRRICENLGVAFQSQLAKLKGYHWAGVTMIVTPDQRGRPQELAALPLSQVPMWLSHIHPNKLTGEGAERLQKIRKLKQYQLEAVDVLYRHFLEPHFGPQPANHAGASQAPQDPILALTEAIAAQRREQLALESKVTDLDQGQRMIQSTLGEVKQRVDEMRDVTLAAQGVLAELPRSDRPAAPLTTRSRINILVRTWVAGNDLNLDYKAAWDFLYQQFYYRYHFDAKRKSEHSGRSKLDEVELAGKLEDLYALASELFT